MMQCSALLSLEMENPKGKKNEKDKKRRDAKCSDMLPSSCFTSLHFTTTTFLSRPSLFYLPTSPGALLAT